MLRCSGLFWYKAWCSTQSVLSKYAVTKLVLFCHHFFVKIFFLNFSSIFLMDFFPTLLLPLQHWVQVASKSFEEQHLTISPVQIPDAIIAKKFPRPMAAKTTLTIAITTATMPRTTCTICRKKGRAFMSKGHEAKRSTRVAFAPPP